MSRFPVLSTDQAPEPARALLTGAGKRYGFVPNLLGVMAQAPPLLEAYTQVAERFAQTSLTPVEQQVVLLAASHQNGCDYCVAAHSTIASMSKVPAPVIAALRAGEPIAEPKLEALRTFTRSVVEGRGWVDETAVDAFLGAGFEAAQVLEVVLGVGMKTLSNYTNHVTQTPLDDAFAPQAWQRPA